MRGSRDDRGRLRLPHVGAGRGRGCRDGSARPFLGSPIGVVLTTFLATPLVGLTMPHATGPSFSGLMLGWGGTTDTSAPSVPAPLMPDTSDFSAAHVIDGEVLYDSQAMTRKEIATFPTRADAGCQPDSDGAECLTGATFSVPAHQVSIFCPGGIGVASGTNTTNVIWKVSQICDVNLQMLLALIHKEQELLIASDLNLSTRGYETAAGHACPDHEACDL